MYLEGKKNFPDLTDIVVYETYLILLTVKALSCDKKDSCRATVFIGSKPPTSSTTQFPPTLN